MPAKRKAKIASGGPYLAAAFFCESLIQDKSDNTHSAIRIIDRTEITLSPDVPLDLPSKEQPFPIQLHAFIAVKSGDSPGAHKLTIELEGPSGKKEVLTEQEMMLTSEPNGGANTRVNLDLRVSRSGLFWLNLFLDGKPLTRMPYMVEIKRLATPPAPPPPAG